MRKRLVAAITDIEGFISSLRRQEPRSGGGQAESSNSKKAMEREGEEA